MDKHNIATLAIDKIGMYILNVVLTSLNGEYSFEITFNSI